MYRETVSLSIVPANVTIPVVVPILNKLEAKKNNLKKLGLIIMTYD